jgi:PilZ domain
MSLLHFRFNERRRTLRVTLTVGLTVKWLTEKGEKFSVKTNTLSVSREGGLFPMEEPVVVGQLLNVHNENSGKSIECKVTTIRKARDGKTYVGMEFVAPNVNFWQMCFPVPGTRPLRRNSSSNSKASA